MTDKNPLATITIGTLAKQANVTIETIRYYQRIGIINQPPKPYSGFRKYNVSTVTMLKFIKNSQKLGFTLKEIKGLINLNVDSCPNIKSSFKKRLISIQNEISELLLMKNDLNKLLKICEKDNSKSICKVIESLNN
jgi:MerR family mercuric resistance operon transcriptional regulator